MKKFLSLVLALAMAMSLVVVNTSAKEFTDDADITYDEAVAVVSEIGIVDGYTDGSFNPTNGLTRGAAAKIICNLILGPTTAAELHADTAPYSDVPITNEFAGYIAYCSQQGIISGYANGTFRPAAPLTGYAFMKMLLGALGYDQYTEGYTGENWSIAVAKQAIGIGLNAGLTDEFNGVDYVNREEACLYAFNTLQADLVEYDTVINTTINGQTVTIGNSIPQSKKWGSSATRINNIKNDQYIQFAEQYFNKLVRDEDIDDFGRPSNVWTYNGEEIGTYVDWTKMVSEYTEAFEYGDLYNDIGATAAKEYDVYSYVDGYVGSVDEDQITRRNDTDVPDTDLGALTQVFIDVDAKEVYVTTINTWLAKVISDYNEKNGYATVEVYTGRNSDGTTASTTKRLSDEDFAVVKDMVEDDFYTVNMSKGVVKIIGDPEVVGDVTISEYSSKPANGQSHKTDTSTRLKQVIVSGETYKTAAQAWFDAEYLYDYAEKQLDGYSYDLLLDQYGYVLGIKNVTSDEDTFFVVGYENGSSFLAQTVDKALVIFPDGTMKTVDAMEKKGTANIPGAAGGSYRVNAWYDYTINSDGVYVISGLTNRQTSESVTPGTTIDKAYTTIVVDGNKVDSSATPPAYVYGNSDSVYIAVDSDTDVNTAGSIVSVNGVTTGIKNTSIDVETGLKYDDAKRGTWGANYNVFALYNKSGYVTYAVVIGEDGSIADKYVYLTSGITAKYYDSDLKDYVYRYDALINGEETEIKSLTAFDVNSANLVKDTLYKASYDADGFVTDMENVEAGHTMDNTTAYKANGYSVDTGNATLTLAGATLYLTADNNTHYAILDENCRFYVNGKDDTDGKYNEYANANAMLAALGTDHKIDAGKIVVIADKDSGFATSIIVLDTVYYADGSTPIDSNLQVWDNDNGAKATTMNGQIEIKNGEVKLNGNMYVVNAAAVPTPALASASNVQVSYKITTYNYITNQWDTENAVTVSSVKTAALPANTTIDSVSTANFAVPANVSCMVEVTISGTGFSYSYPAAVVVSA